MIQSLQFRASTHIRDVVPRHSIMHHVVTRRFVYRQGKQGIGYVSLHRAYSVITQPRFEDVPVNVGSSGHVNLRYVPTFLILMILKLFDAEGV